MTIIKGSNKHSFKPSPANLGILGTHSQFLDLPPATTNENYRPTSSKASTMSQKLYPPCEDKDDHLDALIATYVNTNRSKIKVPVARVY